MQPSGPQPRVPRRRWFLVAVLRYHRADSNCLVGATVQFTRGHEKGEKVALSRCDRHQESYCNYYDAVYVHICLRPYVFTPEQCLPNVGDT